MASAAFTPAARVQGRPDRQGLYDPANEHDACGVGMVADMHGRKSHDIVENALTVLKNLDHRGAVGAEPDDGDGVGILVQIPDAFFREVCDFPLPDAGAYAAGIAFLPRTATSAPPRSPTWRRSAWTRACRSSGGASCRTTRTSPARPRAASCRTSRSCSWPRPPRPARGQDRPGAGPRRVLHARARRAARAGVLPEPVQPDDRLQGDADDPAAGAVLPDLSDRRFTSAIALVHSRFSTNTFPAWELAHPYRFIAHNGEINTVKGNRNWMRAREALLKSDVLPGELSRIYPVIDIEASDTASFDECLELLHLGGRSLPHAVLMMIPEAWERTTPRWTPTAARSTSSTPP